MAYIPNYKSTPPKTKQYDPHRTSDPFYHTNQWTKKSKSQRNTEIYCRQCKIDGYTTIGQEADHVIPISKGGSKLDDRNIQTLCKRCHDRKRKLESMGIIAPHVLNDFQEKIPALS